MPDAIAKREIADDCGLLRRITQIQFVSDGNGGWRPSSSAFKTQEMSVDAECIIHELGHDWAYSIDGNADCGLVRLPAGDFRAEGLAVTHAPLENNVAHCLVGGDIKSGPAKRLVRKATVLKAVVGITQQAD